VATEAVFQIAPLLKEVSEALSLRCYVKTSGRTKVNKTDDIEKLAEKTLGLRYTRRRLRVFQQVLSGDPPADGQSLLGLL